MTASIDFSLLTLNVEEAREVSQVVFEEVYAKPELTDVHEVMTGVEMDRYIPIFGQFGLLGKIDPGSCSNNDETDLIPVSQKEWTPKLISFKLAHCQADLPALLKFWKKDKIAAKTWEAVNDEMAAFIKDRALDATLETILRIVEFGDTAADVVANGGNLTAGTTKTYFNMLDGFWKQVYTDQAGSGLIYRHTEDANAEATKVAQDTLAVDAALKAMRALYNNIDPRAFKGRNLKIQMTRSYFNNWQDFLEDKSLVFTLATAENGSTKFSYRGIPIVIRDDWDRMIRTYHDLGDTYHFPHRMILTDLGNIPIGTSDEESLTSLKSWYSMDDEKHYIKVAFKLDVKILLEYALAVAY